jgi:hypothetical protein
MHPAESIASRIHAVRGLRVIVDADLAVLYGVQTRTLLQAVRRNPQRFPADFKIALSAQELALLRSQSVISKPQGRGGRRHATMAFTEHGAIMAATVLSSARAIKVSVHVVRAFVHMREALTARKEIGKRLDELESKVGTHDRAIAEILGALRRLAAPPEAPRRRRIGFR